MRTSRVRQCWERGLPALCTTVHLTDPSVSELVSLMGFDGITVDSYSRDPSALNVETMGSEYSVVLGQIKQGRFRLARFFGAVNQRRVNSAEPILALRHGPRKRGAPFD